MPLSKRVIASRAAFAISAETRKRRRISRDNSQSTIPDVELAESDVRQLESSNQPESLQPQTSTQAGIRVTSERDSGGSYAGESGDSVKKAAANFVSISDWAASRGLVSGRTKG